jgi:hypothetical protein
MKKIVLIAIAMFAFTLANAQQIEVKINPIGALFGSPDVSAEYLVNETFGAELTLSAEMGKYSSVTIGDTESEIRKSGFGVMGAGKYYFSPDDGCDKFYAGLYLRQKSYKVYDKLNDDYNEFKRSIFAGGLMIGYKWVGETGFVFEGGFGGGKAFVEKNEWLNDYEGGDVDIKLGVDLIGKLAIGYRF